MHIKVDDTVVVLKGLEKPSPVDAEQAQKADRSEAKLMKIAFGKNGETKEFKYGKVLKIYRERNKVLVEGVNMVYKHMKKSRQNPRGGRLHKEMPVQLSNVMLLCPSCKKPAKTGVRVTAEGDKHRFCKKCDANIGQISKKKKPAAK
ncbi:MAG: 50S ribosomal protein L24 [Pirellulales bacterium]